MFFNRISKLIQYTLTVTQPANGSITVNGKTGTSFVFDDGDKVTIKATPVTGYKVDNLNVTEEDN